MSVITLFFKKFCLSLRNSHEELIWCTNYLNANIHTFCKPWSFIWGTFFPVRILKFLLQLQSWFIIFWDFLMFYQIFFSPQVKRSVIVSHKHSKCEYAQPYSQNKNFVNISKKLLKYRYWTFPAARYFTWKLECVKNILSMIVDKEGV